MLPMLRKTLIRTHAQELVAVRTGKEPDALLRELYVDRGLSQMAIAAELGITRATVAMWLREFGIERPA